MKSKMFKKNNKTKIIKMMIIVILIIEMFALLKDKSEVANQKQLTEVPYTISQGETLWSIAKQYKQENQDIRDYIYKVKKINKMDKATVFEGQTITIIK